MERKVVNKAEVCPGKYRFLIKQNKSSWSENVILKKQHLWFTPCIRNQDAQKILCCNFMYSTHYCKQSILLWIFLNTKAAINNHNKENSNEKSSIIMEISYWRCVAQTEWTQYWGCAKEKHWEHRTKSPYSVLVPDIRKEQSSWGLFTYHNPARVCLLALSGYK